MSIFNRKQSVEIDYDKLADAIVKAQKKADTQTIKNAIIEANKEQLAKKENELQKEKEEWIKSFNCKETDCIFIKDLKTFLRLFRIKQKDIHTSGIINKAVIKMALISTYNLIAFVILIVGVFPTIAVIRENSFENLWITIPILVLAIVIFRIIRVARFEIENISNENYLLSLFSSITSFIAMIIAVVALFVTVKI